MKRPLQSPDRHEFQPLLVEIEDQPLNPLGRFIFWTILAVMVFGSLWLVLGRIDVVVAARGKVIPVGEVKTVQPLSAGVVRSIAVKPGDLVEAGQVLMEIDPSEIDPELASLRSERQQLELDLLRLRALLAETDFAPAAEDYPAALLRIETALFRAAREHLAAELGVRQEALRSLRERLAGQEQGQRLAAARAELADGRRARLETVRDLLSRDDQERAGEEAREARIETERAAHGAEEIRAEIERVRREMVLVRSEERRNLLAELAEKRQQEANLAGRIEQAEFRSSRQRIVAPVRGHVAQLLVHTVGGVVTPAEKLATIVPAAAPLVVKALVSNQDVGFIAPGMEVSLKIDAFEYQKYGLLTGDLLQVARDSVEDRERGLLYEVLARPRSTTLTVDGRETPITAGMGVTAEIKVGRRRIIEFFVYPLIKYWNEGTSVR